MKGYVLSKAAVADLDDIWDYTFDNWGQEQADRYVNDIRKACEALGLGQRSGRPIDDIWPGLFKLAINSHFLFYRALEDGRAGIVRILHKRMNVEARLGDTPLH
ncbi:toxin ParE1/3/4 [Rhizobium sp. BK650]|uniref:type II toxin-antitoxin system RelE/ParE family toxin n=1 Tax=Rhizobium sp. BK650 TaxID=2586990 RepID=UPI00161406F4|nr:type II toxin-antitoxin system RelE/ParE family toxin [Rhizobium sp. BK650]MBB3659964.1 toxin ParE1/3/4 [Rhizobium sp. BK650]